MGHSCGLYACCHGFHDWLSRARLRCPSGLHGKAIGGSYVNGWVVIKQPCTQLCTLGFCVLYDYGYVGIMASLMQIGGLMHDIPSSHFIKQEILKNFKCNCILFFSGIVRLPLLLVRWSLVPLLYLHRNISGVSFFFSLGLFPEFVIRKGFSTRCRGIKTKKRKIPPFPSHFQFQFSYFSLVQNFIALLAEIKS